MSAIVVRGLSIRKAARRVVAPFDLTVDDGGIVAIVGPTGGGKSALLRAIAGVDPRPDIFVEGEVTVYGRSPAIARELGDSVYLPQDKHPMPQGVARPTSVEAVLGGPPVVLLDEPTIVPGLGEALRRHDGVVVVVTGGGRVVVVVLAMARSTATAAGERVVVVRIVVVGLAIQIELAPWFSHP